MKASEIKVGMIDRVGNKVTAVSHPGGGFYTHLEYVTPDGESRESTVNSKRELEFRRG